MKKLFKNILYIFIYYLICIFILSILNYFNIIGDKVMYYINFIIFIIIIYFNGSRDSIRKMNDKTIYSLLIGLIISGLFFVLNIILGYKINFKLFIYLILIILVSLLSSFRKNKKKL